MTLPPLNAVKTFEAAARHLSFTKAAQELCVTPGAVSRAIAQLEDRLQVPLFHQHKRRLQLTAAGQTYCFQVSQALDRLSSATDELRQHRGEGGVLTIGVLPTFGTRWLIPKLGGFQDTHPSMSVDIKTLPSDFSKATYSTINTEIDLEQYGVDIALYLGQDHWAGMTCEHLFRERLIPVSTPEMRPYLERLVAGDEAVHRYLLLHSTRPQVWHHWFKQQGYYLRESPWRARFEHYFMVIDAVMSGLGIGLLPEILIREELLKGHFVTVEGTAIVQPQHYSLLYPSVRHNENKIRCFREWLLNQLQEEKKVSHTTATFQQNTAPENIKGIGHE